MILFYFISAWLCLLLCFMVFGWVGVFALIALYGLSIVLQI